MKKYIMLFLISPMFVLAYGPKDINLSNFGFERYVRPQLINISQDYHTLLTILNPELKQLKPLSRILLKLKENSKNILKYNELKKTVKLQTTLNQSLNLLREGSLLLKSIPNLKDKNFFSPEDMIQSFTYFQVFKRDFIDLYIQYENTFFLLQANDQFPLTFHNINNDLNTCYNQFNILLIKTSDNRFNSEFMAFWNDFIKPISNIVLPNNDKNLFISKLNKLNLSLNFLNVVLTKRNKKINKQTSSILKVIHNRWNSILKVTLKR